MADLVDPPVGMVPARLGLVGDGGEQGVALAQEAAHRGVQECGRRRQRGIVAGGRHQLIDDHRLMPALRLEQLGQADQLQRADAGARRPGVQAGGQRAYRAQLAHRAISDVAGRRARHADQPIVVGGLIQCAGQRASGQQLLDRGRRRAHLARERGSSHRARSQGRRAPRSARRARLAAVRWHAGRRRSRRRWHGGAQTARPAIAINRATRSSVAG